MGTSKGKAGRPRTRRGASSRRTRGLVALVFLLAVVGTGAAQDGETAEETERSADWRLGYDQKFDGKINVFKSQLTSSYFVFTLTYDTFPYNWRLSDAGPDPENSLVTSHEISDDGLVYTFHLREGVEWSDGEPFNADDVVFSYNAYKDARQNVLAGYVTNMKSIEAVDDYTVRYTLTKPDARVLSAYTPVIPEHIWGDVPLDEIANFDPCCPIVGTGPYVITEFDAKGTTIFEPSPNFWGQKGEIERILMIRYGNKEGQLRDIKLNRLDAVLFGDSKWIDDIEEDPNLKAWSIPTPGFKSIAFNMCPPGGGPPENTCTGPAPDVRWQVVQDEAIRNALAWAIDRENLVRTVFNGQAEPGNGFISPFYKRYFESYEGDPEIGYTYDPERAQQVLADGGWNCPDDGICEKDGLRAEFELLVRAEFKEDQNAAQRIKAWASEVGIQINVSIITEDALITRNYETSPEDKSKYQPNYDAFLWGWGGDLPSPDFNLEVIECGSYWSDTFYCNPEYDPLPQQALRSLDFDERVELMHEAERIMLEDSPYIILVHNNDIQVTRTDTWTGYRPSPEPNGYPFLTSWLQFSLLEPGQRATANYSGAPAVIVGLFLGVVAIFVTSRWHRRREDSGPLEVEPAG
jgi:peptide/nickel transport system substrate-binding protein